MEDLAGRGRLRRGTGEVGVRSWPHGGSRREGVRVDEWEEAAGELVDERRLMARRKLVCQWHRSRKIKENLSNSPNVSKQEMLHPLTESLDHFQQVFERVDLLPAVP